MAKGRKTGGRVKGVPNKQTTVVKAAIIAAYQGIGGTKALIAWAKDNQGEFYTKILPRLVPTEVTGKDGEALTVRVIRDDQPETWEP